MRIDVLTLFPEIFDGVLDASLLGKAVDEGLIEIHVTNIRDFAANKHNSVDDAPYGGGPGMVMQCDAIFAAVESLAAANSLARVVLMSPRGRRLDQALVKELATAPDLVLICGRYEGVDERVAHALTTDEVSIGDYVLSGGELPALVVIEAISRMLPGVIGDWESVETDSFYDGLLGAPQYTRPAEYRGMNVPQVLKDGNHGAIARWRKKESLRVTRERRPDLIEELEPEDRALLAEIEGEETSPE
jgi:tRNA (guanine37-N1)-methyltransferase